MLLKKKNSFIRLQKTQVLLVNRKLEETVLPRRKYVWHKMDFVFNLQYLLQIFFVPTLRLRCPQKRMQVFV
jgi:hypothetical protein